MDSSLWGLVESIMIDMVVLTVMILIFEVLKKYRGNPDPEQKYNLYLHESSLRFWDRIKRVYSTNLEDIKQVCGEESMNYLYLSKTLAIFINILCLYSVPVLIPIYSLGTGDTAHMHNFGFYNIIDNVDLLIAPQAVFFFNVILSYYMLRLYVQETMKNHSHSTLNKFAVRVIKLPREITCQDLQSKVEKCFEEKYNIYVVPALCKAIFYQKELENAKLEYMHYLDYEEKYQRRGFILAKLVKGEKKDAIEYWEEKIDVLEGEIKKQREFAEISNSGTCIISLQKIAKISEFQVKLQKVFPGCKVTPIVFPDDLNWENIENEESSRAKHACYTLVFFYIFVIVLTPTAFFSYVSGLLSHIGLPDAFIGFLSLYAPEIIMLVYQLFLVPKTVSYLVYLEKHSSKSHEVLSAMKKYLLFFMFNMLFVPALGMQAIDIITTLLDSTSFNKLSKDMVKRINNTSIWFMIFILTQAFIVNGRDLLQIGNLFEVKYKAFRAISEREKYNAYLPEKMNYAVEYATLLTCFTAIFIYSVSYPLILLLGSVYLWIRVFFI